MDTFHETKTLEEQEEILSKIKSTVENRKVLREHAREELAAYSRLNTWIFMDEDGNLYAHAEAQGQSYIVTDYVLIAKTGSFEKSFGEYYSGFSTQRDYLRFLLKNNYDRIFEKKQKRIKGLLGKRNGDSGLTN